MEKNRSYLRIFILAIAAIAVLHSGAYLITGFGSQAVLAKNSFLSGLSINPANNSTLSASFSEILMIFEWAIALVGIVFLVLRQKMDLKREIINLYVTKKYYSSEKPKTDIDILYEILQEKGHLKMESIAKVFHVSKTTAMEWAKVLQNGKLANIYYPQFGEPEVIIK